MALSEGQMVGQYKIVSQLGFGGMATVYKAYHARLDRFVAIKIMHQAFQQDRTFLARFEREAQIVARLEHAHIVPIYDFADHENQPYLVMKLVEGRSLKQQLYQQAPTLDEVVALMSDMADALDYAHRAGVLHRDIKPSNIIIADDATPYLTDFGLARMAQISDSTLSADVMLGTPHYISPEQALGSRDLTPATDLYSLAVVLYELVVGRVPYVSDTPFAVIHSHIYNPLPQPSAINADIQAPVEAVLVRALAKKPDDRYPTAAAMIEAFKAALAESGTFELSPDRIRIASERIDNIPTVSDTPTPISSISAADHAARAPRSDDTSDPELTASPTPLPRRIESPIPPAPVPTSFNPAQIGDKIGEWGNRIGEWGARMGELGEQWGERLEQWGQSIDADSQKRAREAAKVKARNEEGAAIYKLPGGGVMVRTANGIEISYNSNEAQQADWWGKIKEGEWSDALNAIMSETDEIAPPDDEAANRRRARQQIKEQQGFFMHLVIFVVVNAMLQFFAAGDDFNWALLPLFGWGAGLGAHAVNTYFRTGMREARRIAAIQRAYRDAYGAHWATAPKNDLKKIRVRADRPFRKRREFLTHLAVYLSINALLWSIFIMTDSDFPWPIFPSFFWGMGVVSQFFESFVTRSDDNAVERILRRERAVIEGSAKRKNDALDESVSAKRKNETRLTEDGELTDSLIREIEADERQQRRSS